MNGRITVFAAFAALGIAAFYQTAEAQQGQRPGKALKPVPGQAVHRGTLGKGQLPWSATYAKLLNHVTNTPGYYIWHDDNFVYLVADNNVQKGLKFSGEIVVKGGTVGNLSGYANEKADSERIVGTNKIQFRFDTHKLTDGLKFQISGGTKIAFHLKQGKAKSNEIFYGPTAIKAPASPVIFDLAK